MVLTAVSILIPPTFLHSVSHPSRLQLQTLSFPQPSRASSLNRAAGWRPDFPLHREPETIREALHRSPPPTSQALHLCPQYSGFPPTLVNKPPLLPAKTEGKSCLFSIQNPWDPVLTQSQSLYEGRPGPCSALCRLASCPHLLIPSPLAVVPGTDQASYCFRTLTSAISPTWEVLPLNIRKAHCLALFRSVQISPFQRGLSRPSH